VRQEWIRVVSRYLCVTGWLTFGCLCIGPKTVEAASVGLACKRTVGEPEEVAALGRTFASWAESVRASDTAGLIGLVTEDAQFWTHGLPELRGRAAMEQAWKDVFADYRVEQSFECREVIQSGEWAFVRGVEHNRVVPRNGDAAVDQQQRAFSVLSRGIDGRWRFARGMTNVAPQPGSGHRGE
jgi:uncharacterized protein (TIGR02246 family)